MVLECNIDSKGRAMRLVAGLLALLGGAVAYLILMLEIMPVPESIGTVGVLAMVIGGAFAIFEAKAGWCVVRALGFRTRY
ncbi:MAG: hypothetical protein CMA31_06800 [Euryarchaeota archaeon]|nr:hypothetical protein [Euryarchaeota archaeon]|tara:strand:+ start:183 stop:422 length:240 start_codon:yes stop_codon:yes gene_type:complete